MEYDWTQSPLFIDFYNLKCWQFWWNLQEGLGHTIFTVYYFFQDIFKSTLGILKALQFLEEVLLSARNVTAVPVPATTVAPPVEIPRKGESTSNLVRGGYPVFVLKRHILLQHLLPFGFIYFNPWGLWDHIRVRSEYRNVEWSETAILFLEFIFTFSLWGVCFNWRCSIWHIFPDMQKKGLEKEKYRTSVKRLRAD
jgi:hypothetical protein